MLFTAFCSCIFVMFFAFRNSMFSMFLLIWFEPWMSTAVYCAIIVLYHAMVFTDFKFNCTNFSCKKYIISIDKIDEEKNEMRGLVKHSIIGVSKFVSYLNIVGVL